MPLDKSGTKAAFSKNVSELMHTGRPQRQALAIAYSINRKGRAEGGAADDDMLIPPPRNPARMPKAVEDTAKAMTADPISDAYKAVRGRMTPEEAQNFAMTAAMGLISPMARGAKLRLPMDEVSRMGRATEQGYTIDAYKGMYPYTGGPVTDWKGRVLSETPKEEIKSIKPHAFFSSDPETANRFASAITSEGSVLPAKLKFENPIVIDANGAPAAAFQFETIARRHGTHDAYKAFQDAISSKGPHDGVILKNTKDEGTVYLPKNPHQVRSRFAAFDPDKIKSGDLLASGAGLIGANAITQEGQQMKQAGFAQGGPPKMSISPPYYARAEARGLGHTGPILSAVGGRTDHHAMSVPAKSYVLPADHVSSLGQGNSLNGLAVLNKMFPIKHGAGPPRPPQMGRIRAAGGATGGEGPVPIYAAGGEFVISPEHVAELGGGDHAHGHRILDSWVKSNRKKLIKTLSNLPGPAKD